MYKALKKSVAALVLGAVTIGGLAATPAYADRGRDNDRNWKRDRDDRRHHDRRNDRHWKHDRRGPDRVVVIDRRPVVRPAPRVVYAYDWNRPDPRYRGYYADRYYRGGYAPIRVTRQTRVYRGYDNRYYCRRSDGTTGLIIGAAVGGLLGDQIDQGRSSILGAVLGAGAGAMIGREIDRGDVVCR
ncbi:glycine zipper 2TM domain-containing protein [Sphingobium sp. SYK-6]|uniref:glycine zipper 2TM domain-containing protein n=1 Tax=Sphingobium sp. (strain NBRC 103272 / SYK-6) TaxID=627192 RepID=UPI000316004A|nr:glycine zipper 2TM domain-containing protein [Sphingobium sp. SYK-6]